MAFLTVALSVPLTATLPWKRPARPAGLPAWPKIATALEKPTTPTAPFDVPITPGRLADEPNTPAAFGTLGLATGGPWLPEMPVTPERSPEILWTPGPKNDTARS